MTDREAEWAAPMGRLGLATAAEPNITTVILLFHIITARQFFAALNRSEIAVHFFEGAH